MNDNETKLQFKIVDERYQSSTSRLESRLSELNRDVKCARAFKRIGDL